MTKTHKALRSHALSTPIEIYEVDGIALSAKELNLVKLLMGKFAEKGNGSVIDIGRASKRRLRSPSRS
jgi:hypothetical protein